MSQAEQFQKALEWNQLAEIQIKNLQNIVEEQSALLIRAADALVYYKHDSGCPAIADDEGDFEYLADAGQCVCRARKCDIDDLITELRKATE